QLALGDRAVQDRLHQRGGPLPGDARAARLQGPDRGAARFVGQALACRRRQPHQEVAREPHGQPAKQQLSGFREDVIAGLSLPRKSLPPKYFYDPAGSRLFERICRLREYYLTRAELALTRAHIAAIARFAGSRGTLIEYGSGASVKSRLLIRALRPATYIAVDISHNALQAA